MIQACVLPHIHDRNAYPYYSEANTASAAAQTARRDRSKSDSTHHTTTVSLGMLNSIQKQFPHQQQQQQRLGQVRHCDDVIDEVDICAAANQPNFDLPSTSQDKRVTEMTGSNLRRAASTPTLAKTGKQLKMPEIVQTKVKVSGQQLAANKTTPQNQTTSHHPLNKKISLPRVNSNASKSTSKTNEKSDKDNKKTLAGKSSRRASGDSGLGGMPPNNKTNKGPLRNKPIAADKGRKMAAANPASNERAESDSINSTDADGGCQGNADQQCPLEADRYDRIIRWLSEVAASASQAFIPCDYLQTDTAIHMVWTE